MYFVVALVLVDGLVQVSIALGHQGPPLVTPTRARAAALGGGPRTRDAAPAHAYQTASHFMKHVANATINLARQDSRIWIFGTHPFDARVPACACH